MRAESQAPRNSRELAVRNQFFTPRYVVEFLTDNTLGRIWYEMRQGKTRLVNKCNYLVHQPKEIFLLPGEEPPAGLPGESEKFCTLAALAWRPEGAEALTGVGFFDVKVIFPIDVDMGVPGGPDMGEITLLHGIAFLP